MRHSNENYEVSRVAVDAVICTIRDAQLFVYLNVREKPPGKGLFELPGGLLLARETAEATLARKVTDVVSARPTFLEQFYTFTTPDRDSRTRTISIGSVALLPAEEVVDWDPFQSVESLPKLAFDHRQIIETAINYLRGRADYQFIRHLLPKQFPLNQAQMVYEVLLGETVDNRNFRKKLLASGLVKKIDQRQANVPHRPAALYQFL